MRRRDGMLLLLGLLGASPATAQPTPTRPADCTPNVVPVAASILVQSVLQSRGDFERNEQLLRGKPEEWSHLSRKILESLKTILEDQSSESDEALVALMGFYLGEHFYEMKEEEVLRRGARMEPLVRRYGSCRPVLATGLIPDDMRWLGTGFAEVLKELQGSIRKSVALTRAELDLNGNGATDLIAIVFKSEKSWKREGRLVHWGYFSAVVTFAGHQPVETSLNRLLKTDMTFHGGPWKLVIQDYNHNGIADFNLGQWCEYESYCYGLLTVDPDGRVRELPVIPEEKCEYEPTVDDQANSTTKIELTESGFKCIDRNDDRSRFESVYRWDSKTGAFRLVSRTPLTPDR